jgi:hypothetical protein
MKCYDCGSELTERNEERTADSLASWQHNAPALSCPAYAAFYALAKSGTQPYKHAVAWEEGADVWVPAEG